MCPSTYFPWVGQLKGKFGIYVPESLANELEECMKALGLRSKSALVREALKLFISEHKWKTARRAVGIIGLIYDHEMKGVDEELTDIQHAHLGLVVSTLHVHLDKRRCMLAIVVRGRTDEIKELLGKLVSIRGVEIARTMLLAMEGEAGQEHEHGHDHGHEHGGGHSGE